MQMEMPSLRANGSLLSKRHGKSVWGGWGGSEIGLQRRGCFLKLCASAAELSVVTLVLLFPAHRDPGWVRHSRTLGLGGSSLDPLHRFAKPERPDLP